LKTSEALPAEFLGVRFLLDGACDKGKRGCEILSPALGGLASRDGPALPITI
jgi:hypothetical protein